MAETGYVGHTAPDGETVGDRFREFAPTCSGRSENVAKAGVEVGMDEAAVAEKVVSGWMNSPGHRENLLREGVDSQGIGVWMQRENGVVVVYVTQTLCGR